MKKFTLLASLLMFVMLSYAANVIPVETAMKASKNFLAEQVGTTKASQLELVLEHTEYSPDGVPVTYRFRVGDKGFIIVSATDLACPVLAFSLESNYKEGTSAEVCNEMYTESLSQLISNSDEAIPANNSWNRYLSPKVRSNEAKEVPSIFVEPLVTTRWTQERFYNTVCPYNPRATYNEDARAVVGCVALTMANILYYYRYPEQGIGVVSYIPREIEHGTNGHVIYTYPSQTVNYGQATYDYNAMGNSLRNVMNYQGGYDGELAKLIYHCGVATQMSYGSLANEGSGTSSPYALQALKDQYGYSDKGQYKQMSDVAPSSDLVYMWEDMARAELDAHRPLFYSGSTTTGGHAWIVDGYITNFSTITDSISYTSEVDSITYSTVVDSITYSTVIDSISIDTVTYTIVDSVVYSHFDSITSQTIIDSVIYSSIDSVVIDSINYFHIDSVIYSHIDSVIYYMVDSIYTHLDSVTYFHVNWGWAGQSNGYYLINHQTTQVTSTLEDSWVFGNAMMVNLMPDSAAIQKPVESFTRVTSSFGTISDGAGNMKYAPNSNRRWVLACPDATSYKLKFSKLKVKSGDKVIVYNGGTESTGVKKTYFGDYLMAACEDYHSASDSCFQVHIPGTPLPDAITVTADSVLIVFTSNGDEETDYGFVLDYEVTFNKPTCQTAEYTDFSSVLTDKPNNAISDEDYRASSICEYNIKLQFCDKLVYAFQKFDLKDGDFVDIYNQTTTDADSRVRIAHFDVNNQPTIGEVFEYNAPLIGGKERAMYTVRFASDNKIQGSGFQLTYYGIQTSINNYNNVDINIYPNPATSFVNVQVSSDDAQQFNAKVVNMMGKTVYVDQFNHDGGTSVYQIPVNNLAKGIYVLHLNNGNGSTVQKFIVQ